MRSFPGKRKSILLPKVKRERPVRAEVPDGRLGTVSADCIPVRLESAPSRVPTSRGGNRSSIDQTQGVKRKRLRRWELTLSWIGRPWVLRGSHRWEKDSDRQVRIPGFVLQVRSCWRRHGSTGAQANSPLESAESESAMGWLVRFLRGPTTSRNPNPIPARIVQ